MQGHDYAVKKVAWSPHLSDVLLSGGYDMTVRVFEDGSKISGPDDDDAAAATGFGNDESAMKGETVMGACMGTMNSHTEFINGLDWCLFGAEGWCASVGWDERVLVWDARECMTGGGKGMGLG